MPTPITTYKDLPGAPRSEVYPLISFGYFTISLGASASIDIPHSVDPAIVPDENDWNIGAKNILSFSIWCGHQAGGVLEVSLSPNGSDYEVLHTWTIFANDTTHYAGIELNGWTALFHLKNNDSSTTRIFRGIIQLKGF